MQALFRLFGDASRGRVDRGGLGADSGPNLGDRLTKDVAHPSLTRQSSVKLRTNVSFSTSDVPVMPANLTNSGQIVRPTCGNIILELVRAYIIGMFASGPV